METFKKILNEHKVPYEEYDFQEYTLIRIFQYPVDDLSELAKRYSVQCTIIKFKNKKYYEVGYDFDIYNNSFEIKQYNNAKDIFNERIKYNYITQEDIIDVKKIGKIEEL